MKTSTFIIGVLTTIVTLWVGFFYTGGVADRNWIIEHNAFETFTSHDGQYRLEYGVTTPDFNWMRLYRNGDSEVIADRRFYGEVPYKIYWFEKRVSVGGAEEGSISLPPHWWERWTAKLP